MSNKLLLMSAVSMSLIVSACGKSVDKNSGQAAPSTPPQVVTVQPKTVPTPAPTPGFQLPPQLLATSDCGTIRSDSIDIPNIFGSNVSTPSAFASLRLRTNGALELMVEVAADDAVTPTNHILGAIRYFSSTGHWEKDDDKSLALYDENDKFLGTLYLPDLEGGYPASLAVVQERTMGYGLPARMDLSHLSNDDCEETKSKAN